MTLTNGNLGAYRDVDFQSRFPHKLWLSAWSDRERPENGFRVRVRAVRERESNLVDLVVLVTEPGGLTSEVSTQAYPLAVCDRAASAIVGRYALQYGVDFEEFDFSSVSTVAEFERLAQNVGW